MVPAQPPKRVTRACDYCRKKRLKCTGQRPCLNCQLYSAHCSTSEHPRGPDNASSGAPTTRKRKRVSTRSSVNQNDQDEEIHHESRLPAPVPTEEDNPTPILQQEQQEQPVEASQVAPISSPWIPASEPQMVHPVEMAPDFDQYAHDLGFVLAPFWPTSSRMSTSLDGLDCTDEGVSGIPYNHLPTPRLSGTAPSPPSVGLGLAPGASYLGDYGMQTETTDHPLSSRSAHELFLKKGPLESKFLGMGSIGSTIFECLRHSSSIHGPSMEATILNHLVRGIQYVDEIQSPAKFIAPPLPERNFAEQGVKHYYDYVHSIYPIMEGSFFLEWRQIYDNASTISPTEYSRFCLVVAIGNLANPLRSDNDSWRTATLLQRQVWSLIDWVMAVPFLESTQVMLLHTVFLLYCGKIGISWMTCGIAIRMAQSLGLHQHTPAQLDLGIDRINLRSRLWSVAYTLDAFLSLSEGRPPAATVAPDLELSHSISAREGPLPTADQVGIYIHDLDISLAMLANEVHLVLKESESLSTTMSRIAEIDARLLAWKDSIPMDFRPDQQILAEGPLYSIVAILHLKYHNLMRSIHWISLTLSSEQPSARPLQLGARVRSSEAICLASARSVIDVLNTTADQRIAGRHGGLVVSYCMAAISIFYRQIMKAPTRHGARSNLEHIRDGTLYITGLYNGIDSRSHFQALFGEMLRLAEEAVNNTPR